MDDFPLVVGHKEVVHRRRDDSEDDEGRSKGNEKDNDDRDGNRDSLFVALLSWRERCRGRV